MPPARKLITASTCLAALLAGCGGSSSSHKASSAPAKGITSLTVKQTKVGAALAGPGGATLYLFEADKGPSSTCSGSCAAVWPPLLSSGPAHAGPGINASLLGTSRRADGASQVTYGGHPLYTYVKDKAADDNYGQGLVQFGASWYVLSAKGSKIDAS